MDEIPPSMYVPFFEGLSARLKTLQDLRSVYDEQMAFNFNATRFFWPGENKTSEILAFFLNPRSNHGQKDAFLRVFCETLLPGDRERWAPFIGAGTTVEIEQRDCDGRIDILVSFDKGKFLVGIENKLGAPDQPKQLTRYSKALKRASHDNYCLLYLNPDGHDPTETSISPELMTELTNSGRLRVLSYEEDIIDLFEQFIMVCKSDKVTAFLRDFQNYLRFQYTAVYNMDDTMTIKDFITKSDNIELALQVAHNISFVRQALLDKVHRELDEWKKSKDGEAPLKVLVGTLVEIGNRKGRVIELQHMPWNLIMEFQSGDMCRPAIILQGRKEKPVDIEFLRSIKDEWQWEGVNESHPNVHFYPQDYFHNWNTNLSPWLDMVRPSDDTRYSIFTKKIIDWHDRASEAIEDRLRT